MSEEWRSDEVLAYTRADGPEPAPAGIRWYGLAGLAGVLSVSLLGVFATDALCPEHLVLVDALAMTALLSAVVAIVGLVRSWASAPALTLFGSAAGLAIAGVELAHGAKGGQLTLLAFAVATAGACALWWWQTSLRRWDRAIAPTPAPTWLDSAPSPTVGAEPARADESADEPSDEPEVPVTP